MVSRSRKEGTIEPPMSSDGSNKLSNHWNNDGSSSFCISRYFSAVSLSVSVARITRYRKAARPKSGPRRTRRRTGSRYWSRRVTRESDALDLHPGVFSQADPKRIAASLKRSAEKSSNARPNPITPLCQCWFSTLTALVGSCRRAASAFWRKRKSSCADCLDGIRPKRTTSSSLWYSRISGGWYGRAGSNSGHLLETNNIWGLQDLNINRLMAIS